MVFYFGGDDVEVFWGSFEFFCDGFDCAEDCEVVAFCSTAGEDDFAIVTVQEFCDGCAGLFDCFFGFAAA